MGWPSSAAGSACPSADGAGQAGSTAVGDARPALGGGHAALCAGGHPPGGGPAAGAGHDGLGAD
ncbi:MAG: hypothetical protein QM591_13405, partial [Microbacterium sp.]